MDVCGRTLDQEGKEPGWLDRRAFHRMHMHVTTTQGSGSPS